MKPPNTTGSSVGDFPAVRASLTEVVWLFKRWELWTRLGDMSTFGTRLPLQKVASLKRGTWLPNPLLKTNLNTEF